MQKVNEIFGLLSPKQLTTLDNKTLRDEAATTLANLYLHDLEKDELAVEIESFKYSVIVANPGFVSVGVAEVIKSLYRSDECPTP
ncbi:hypothetical protein AVEN_183173-1 [Araneus ventricosus]|uniref:Uncharacterized protein n=1 Tax=Araneus ventricosus TaxID=182803 RepID=A0A4Y2IYN3_ARAVE|nr:hypothetical protein AVEN_183173-1 [Araneus ventricosus]